LIKGKTIKEIVRDLKVSRNTVRKVLRSGETAFEYERTVQPRPKLGGWTADLDALLTNNVTKPAREQLTLIRIFEELRNRGYDGGYDAVRRCARRWAEDRGTAVVAAYVPLSFAPGEAYQFDWSHEVVLLSGVTVFVKVAHVRLCQSRMPFVRAYPTQGSGPARLRRLEQAHARPSRDRRSRRQRSATRSMLVTFISKSRGGEFACPSKRRLTGPVIDPREQSSRISRQAQSCDEEKSSPPVPVQRLHPAPERIRSPMLPAFVRKTKSQKFVVTP
jgi:hypothetical protein